MSPCSVSSICCITMFTKKKSRCCWKDHDDEAQNKHIAFIKASNSGQVLPNVLCLLIFSSGSCFVGFSLRSFVGGVKTTNTQCFRMYCFCGKATTQKHIEQPKNTLRESFGFVKTCVLLAFSRVVWLLVSVLHQLSFGLE